MIKLTYNATNNTTEALEDNSIGESLYNVWHDITRPIQIIIPVDVKNDLLLKKQEHDILNNHQDVALLLDYVKNINAPTFNDNGDLYIYLGELFYAHKQLLESFGIQINIKTNA